MSEATNMIEGNEIDLKEGEVITCRNRHEIGIVPKDMVVSGSTWIPDIKWTAIAEPKKEQDLCCPVCGCQWMIWLGISDENDNVTGIWIRVCIDGKWRPSMDERDRKHWPNA